MFPHGAARHALTAPARRRLSRGSVTTRTRDREAILDVLATLDATPPAQGLASFRYLGQTQQTPEGWMAAADPAYLETRLRHLVLHPLPASAVGSDELKAVFATLQDALGGDGIDFQPVGDRGYLRASKPLATAACSAECAVGGRPDDFMPAGADAAPFHRLQSEIQMLLHGHPVNEARAARGQPPINTLWLWGGGTYIVVDGLQLPSLTSDDPLYAGLWSGHGQSVDPFPAELDAVPAARGDAVLTVADDAGGDAPAPAAVLAALLGGLRKGRIGRLSLFLGNDRLVRLGRSDLLRVWRGTSPLLGGAVGDE